MTSGCHRPPHLSPQQRLPIRRISSDHLSPYVIQRGFRVLHVSTASSQLMQRSYVPQAGQPTPRPHHYSSSRDLWPSRLPTSWNNLVKPLTRRSTAVRGTAKVERAAPPKEKRTAKSGGQGGEKERPRKGAEEQENGAVHVTRRKLEWERSFSPPAITVNLVFYRGGGSSCFRVLTARTGLPGVKLCWRFGVKGAPRDEYW